MTTDNKTLADVRPGGRVRLGDRPKDGEVLVEVSGLTGSGKSAIAGEIEILCKALGLDAEWVNSDEEKRLTHADWISALEMYKPKVVIVEQNIPRAALSAQPSPSGQDALTAQQIYDRFGFLEGLVSESTYRRIADEASRIQQIALAARQPSKQPDSVALGEATEFCIEKGNRQPVGEPVAYTSETQLKAVRLCGDGIMSQRNAKWDIPLYLRPAQAVDLPYSLDADPAGIRARVADVITGTLMVGAQGHTPPPAGHWAEPFWKAARADATAQALDLGQMPHGIRLVEIPRRNGLDPINVFVQDYELGRGRIVVTCYGQAWCGFWGAMGDRTVMQFVASCDADYVAGNMLSGRHEHVKKHERTYVERIATEVIAEFRALIGSQVVGK